MPKFDENIAAERFLEIREQEEENLIKNLAAKNGYAYVDLRGITINPDALKLITETEAKAGKMVIFEQIRNRVSVALRNPDNETTRAQLASLEKKGLEPTLFMTSTVNLEHGWERYDDQRNTTAVKRGVLDIDTGRISEQMKTFKDPATVATHLKSIRTLNSARRISETMETMFAGALALRASDIHIEPEENGIRLRYRLDGVLYDVIDFERQIYGRLLSRLKLLSAMILNKREVAQDGRFTFTLMERDVEVRSSIIPGASGESMVMRLLDPSVASFSLESLGLNKQLSAIIKQELKRPNGLIITTGPTGSGKTTALYAFLRETHRPGVKIITIENPVEYKLDDIVQTQVEEDYTFANGLRAVLRQDPDIIMVGEIRDREVAETAIHAAQTGHLVFSTLHTNSAVGAFPRLIDLGVDYRMIGTSINIILGQRLVRVLCEHCKRKREANQEEVAIIKNVLSTHPVPPLLTNPIFISEAVGCIKCNDIGYKGRQGVFEAVQVDTAVEEAIIRDPREHIILEAALGQGIPSMAEDGIEKVLSHLTSLPELQRVVDLTSGRHTNTNNVPPPNTEVVAEDEFSKHIV